MNFTIKQSRDEETVGITAKGNSIRYTIIPEDNIRYWKPSPHLNSINMLTATPQQLEALEQDNKIFRSASRIRIVCSFTPCIQMVDIIENSKILSVAEYTREEKTIEIIPHPLFDYGKLNDVLFDMVNKFEL